MQVQGTTNTGTEVQTAQDRSDQELSDALVTAFQSAESDAKRFIFSTATLATAIMDVHEAEVWKRTIDGETGKLYSSATAYYKSIGSRFPLLHKLLRDELVSELYSADPNAIGVRELAALVHVDPAQVTRSKQKALAAAKAEADATAKAEAEHAAKVAAEAAACQAAAEAQAKAEAEGRSKAEALAAAKAASQAVETFALAASKAEAEAAAEVAAKAEAEAAAKAVAKAVKRAIGSLESGLKQADDERQNMGAEDRALTLAAVRKAVERWEAFDALVAGAPAPAKAEAEAEPQNAAYAEALERTGNPEVAKAAAAATGTSRRGRKASA